MNYDEFKQHLMEDLKDRLSGQYDSLVVDTLYVNKLQGESYDSISLQPHEGGIGASINATKLFNQYQAENDYDAVLAIAEAIALDSLERLPSVDTNMFYDYASIKDKLIVELVPQEGNENMLVAIPHRKIEDMVAIYRIVLDSGEDVRATVLVNNTLLERLGISTDQLHEAAIAASMTNLPPVVKNMGEVLREMSGAKDDFTTFPDSPLQCITNSERFMGASVILYPGLLDEVAEQLGENFFILPSSIHEVLAIPESGGHNYHALEMMVRNINETEVAPVDRLSNNVYHYDGDAHSFELASAYEARIQAQQELLMDELPSVEPPDTMTVLLVEPGKHPKVVEMGTGLAPLQEAVGGYIECVYPFEDPVAVICNEEGKLEGLPLNRALRDDDGEVYDVVAGPFLVVGLTEDDFGSLSSEQIQKFEGMFHQPEAFIKTGRSVIAVPIPDEVLGDKNAPAAGKTKSEPAL